MKLKRFLSIGLCLAMLATLLTVPAFADDTQKTLTLRENWRLTSDLDLAVPQGTTLTIDGNGYHIYEMGGKLLNSGLGTVTFANGTILYPAANDEDADVKEVTITGIWDTAESTALMLVRQSVAKVGSNYYPTLAAAIAAATSGDTVTLLKSFETSSRITANNGIDFTLDMNGKTITAITSDESILVVKSGKVIITGNGTFAGTAASTARGLLSAQETGELIFQNGTVTANGAYYGITAFGTGKVEINGGTITAENAAAVSTNGSADGENFANGTSLKITAGTLTGGDVGVYVPAGTFEVSGGTISGKTGVAAKGGKLTITGGTINGTGSKEEFVHTGNGWISTGDALAIESCNYPYSPSTISITGGSFNSSKADAVATYVNGDYEKASGFITGGTFSSDPSDYVAGNGTSNIVKRSGSGDPYTYTVIARSGLTDGTYLSDPSGATASNYYVSGSNPWTVYYSAPSSGSSGSSSSSTTTQTVTNDDGSTTTTVTDKTTGTVTETTTSTTTDEATGMTTETKTETVTNKDGSKTETATETVTNTDGSKTETTTETKTDADGTTTSTETVTATDATGTTGTTTTTTNANGETTVTAEATVTTAAVTEAAETGEAVTLPVEVPAATTTEAAAEVTISVPASAGSVAVEVPVTNTNPGVVVVLVNADGTEEIVKTSVPTENGVALTVEGSATVKIVDNSKDFVDVKDTDWHDDAVTFVAAREIMNGTGGDAFTPNAPLNRGMIAQVLHNFESNPETSADNLFGDVPDNAWYTDAVKWAAEQKIVEGDGNNYAPTDNITREQLATILYRYANVKGYDMTAAGDLTAFNDGRNTSAWAKGAMEWAVGVGLLQGKGNAKLDPKGNATRAEVAQIFMNFCINVVE